MSTEELYVGREQTLVKHFILRKYLERFAHIVGTRWEVLTYVDCFSGPWNARSDRFKDSSFSIALSELRKASYTHVARGRQLRLRCFFLEKQPAAYLQLDQFAKGNSDAEIKTRNATLEESVSDIVDFVQAGGKTSFPFIFIDPTGWTGFSMEAIAPLLRLNPGEVLINFMTGHIRRFLDSPQDETQESFKRLFGCGDFRARIQGLAQMDREDVAVQEYTRNARAVGGFHYGCNALVLHPEMDRTHFHLIYLTRNAKGIEVFKDIEKKAMEVQETARSEAKQRKRVSRHGQTELFLAKDFPNSTHYESLRDRYLQKAQKTVLHALTLKQRLSYDEAWALAASEPLCWESDLKEWVEEWKEQGHLEIQGLKPRQRVPHRNENNLLTWK
jgi:three-Cys-motif partner protein